MSKAYANGSDDRALHETSWPLPTDGESENDVEWQLRYGHPSRSAMLAASEIVAAYRALICDGTTAQQLKRLAALRRVWQRRAGGAT